MGSVMGEGNNSVGTPRYWFSLSELEEISEVHQILTQLKKRNTVVRTLIPPPPKLYGFEKNLDIYDHKKISLCHWPSNERE